VKLMPPAYVKAYVKRNKNDAADAEAICEAVTRPSMRFVPVKNTQQQSVLLLHRARNLLVRQRTMLVNALRAHMAEFGMVAPQGLRNVELLTKIVAQEQEQLPELAQQILRLIVDQLHDTMTRVRQIELRLTQWHRQAGSASCWRRCPVRALMERKPTKVAAVALANKTARIVRAVMMREDGYRQSRFSGSRHRHGEPATYARVKRT
jgi:hypothetical protein